MSSVHSQNLDDHQRVQYSCGDGYFNGTTLARPFFLNQTIKCTQHSHACIMEILKVHA